MISGTSHHLFQPLLYQVATGVLSEGEVAPATREVLKDQDNVTVLLGRVTDIDLDARTVTSLSPARHDGHAVRQLDRRGRSRAVLLRQRSLRRVRSWDEEHRRRARAPRPDLRLLRARRVVHRPGRGRGVVDVRRGRGRTDGRGDGRPDRRVGAPNAATGLPADRHHEDEGDLARRGAGGARRVRRQAVQPRPRAAGQDRRRRPAQRQGRRRRQHRGGRDRSRRHGAAHQVALQGLGGRGQRLARSASSSPTRARPRSTAPVG